MILSQAELPRRCSGLSSQPEEAQDTWAAGKTVPNLLSSLQAVQCAPGSQLSGAVTRAGVGFGGAALTG